MAKNKTTITPYMNLRELPYSNLLGRQDKEVIFFRDSSTSIPRTKTRSKRLPKQFSEIKALDKLIAALKAYRKFLSEKQEEPK